MPRQDVKVSSALPSDGARIGATPSTRISRESSWAARIPVNRSRTIAMATTATAAPPRPCRVRVTVRSSMEGASGTEHRHHAVRRETDQQRAPAAEGVGQRADDQLAEPEPEQQAGDGQLDLGVGGAHLLAELGQRGQVGVDGQWPDRHQGAQHDDELGRTGGRRRCRRANGSGSGERSPRTGSATDVMNQSFSGRARGSRLCGQDQDHGPGRRAAVQVSVGENLGQPRFIPDPELRFLGE